MMLSRAFDFSTRVVDSFTQIVCCHGNQLFLSILNLIS